MWPRRFHTPRGHYRLQLGRAQKLLTLRQARQLQARLVPIKIETQATPAYRDRDDEEDEHEISFDDHEDEHEEFAVRDLHDPQFDSREPHRDDFSAAPLDDEEDDPFADLRDHSSAESPLLPAAKVQRPSAYWPCNWVPRSNCAACRAHA